MPFANNNGVRIHYEVEGQGPPLVLQHGFSMPSESWRLLGYVDALKQDYRLTLIDARGHGQSDRLHDPRAYGVKRMAGDVVAVLDDLGNHKTHYFGYSMGGRIGFGMAKYHPERLSSLILGGAYADEHNPNEPNPFLDGMVSVLRQGVEAWIDTVPTEYKQAFRTSDIDSEALIALLSNRDPVGLADALPTLAVPVLLFAGEHDPCHAVAARCALIAPAASFVTIPGADHRESLRRVDLVLPHVRRFLAAVEAG